MSQGSKDFGLVRLEVLKWVGSGLRSQMRGKVAVFRVKVPSLVRIKALGGK